MIPVLETQRLRLRPLTPGDAPAMLEIMRGKDVLKYFPVGAPLTIERVSKRITGQLEHWAERDYGIWAVERKGDGVLLGNCGLQILSKAGEPEIDFLFGREHWGIGYATESATEAIRWGFTERGFRVVVGIVHVDNEASKRVLRKLGMKLVDTAEWFGIPCEHLELEKGVFDGGPADS